MIAGHRPLHEIPHRASVLRHRSGRATAYESASWLSISEIDRRVPVAWYGEPSPPLATKLRVVASSRTDRAPASQFENNRRS
jgi:hypothetical protein